MSARVLITGATGFAGRHLVQACLAADEHVTDASRAGTPAVDLLDAQALSALVAEVRPDVVYHLAARAHVGESWARPAVTLSDNVTMTLNLLEAVRVHAPEATVVAVASGELYGPPPRLPVDETAALRPQNPYAVSKASADLLAGFYADAHGLRVIRARPFNHSGPGQAPTYAIASFARQVAVALHTGAEDIEVVTGNPDARRDYTDVRDVVRAYRLLAAGGQSGETYNICSGRPASATELVGHLSEAIGRPIVHRVNPDLIRPNEVMEIRGSHDRLTAATGWVPEITLADTLADTVAWWREALEAEVAIDA